MPDCEAEFYKVVFQDKGTTHAFRFELIGFWVARDIVQYQKNFKRHF